MAEIAALPWNGINVISTFSGCGGSSLGYRMAGCRVLGASEFVPAAYEVYRQNARPGTVLWTEDIRTLDPLQMLNDVGLEPGQLDILDGSPPCAAFSTAGKRSEGWGVVKQYSDTRQRVDDLFYEYARVLEIMQPRAFVAENVEGLVKGVAKGYFKAIYQRLVDCGYVVRAAVLDASWLGVPQQRRRVIFIGTRNDLGLVPVHPLPLPYQYSVADALPHLVHAGRDPHFVTIPKWGGPKSGRAELDRASFTVTATGMSNTANCSFAFATKETKCELLVDPETRHDVVTVSPRLVDAHPNLHLRKLTLQELRRICSFPDDFVLAGTYQQRWERLGRSVPPVMMKHIATAVVETLCAAS